jgi:hypothetical protein
MQYAAREQDLDQWCWAASIQMIFSYYNHDISQERIVEEVFGIAINVPAQPYHILQALNREWVDDDGNIFFCSTRPIPLQNGIISIIDELTNNKPLIIGTLGHAVVLTRIVYYLFPNGVVSVADAGVRDPWPGRGLRSLSINEFNNISFIAIVDIEDYL